MTLFYIKIEYNVVADTFIQITMAHRAHKLADTTPEEDTCDIMCMDLLFVYDKTDCFSLDI